MFDEKNSRGSHRLYLHPEAETTLIISFNLYFILFFSISAYNRVNNIVLVDSMELNFVIHIIIL